MWAFSTITEIPRYFGASHFTVHFLKTPAKCLHLCFIESKVIKQQQYYHEEKQKLLRIHSIHNQHVFIMQ